MTDQDAYSVTVHREQKGFMGFENRACEMFPCHSGIVEQGISFNCLFCYCPLYDKKCCGDYTVLPDGSKDCTNCTVNHKDIRKSWQVINHWLSPKKQKK